MKKGLKWVMQEIFTRCWEKKQKFDWDDIWQRKREKERL